MGKLGQVVVAVVVVEEIVEPLILMMGRFERNYYYSKKRMKMMIEDKVDKGQLLLRSHSNKHVEVLKRDESWTKKKKDNLKKDTYKDFYQRIVDDDNLEKNDGNNCFPSSSLLSELNLDSKVP
jgi:hypothetical protein